MMLPRLRGDGPPRSVADLELPLAAVLALTVGLLLMVWLNGLGGSASDPDEITRVADRPSHIGVRGELAAGAAERRVAAARARIRVRRARAARRVARARAAAALASRRAYADSGFDSRSASGSASYGGTYERPGQYDPQAPAPQQQLQVPQRQAPAPQPEPKPQPKRAGGGFDDSG
jgi:hypothetical protein